MYKIKKNSLYSVNIPFILIMVSKIVAVIFQVSFYYVGSTLYKYFPVISYTENS